MCSNKACCEVNQSYTECMTISQFLDRLNIDISTSFYFWAPAIFCFACHHRFKYTAIHECKIMFQFVKHVITWMPHVVFTWQPIFVEVADWFTLSTSSAEKPSTRKPLDLKAAGYKNCCQIKTCISIYTLLQQHNIIMEDIWGEKAFIFR